MAEQLIYDFSRIGRILLEADRPLTRDEILMRYEQAYMERPLSLSMSELSKRFSSITNTQRGQWWWKKACSSPKDDKISRSTSCLEPSLFDSFFC